MPLTDILIITGLSGAGKSRVAAVLEDMDFYCVDNMPVELMSKFSELISGMSEKYRRVALVTDVRTLGSADEMFRAVGVLKSFGIGSKILFIEASVPTIVKRYKESRRRHPLDADGSDLEDAVRREIELLAPIRAAAYEIIDTSSLTLGSLQTRMVGIFPSESAAQSLAVNVKSFGFKHGLPIEADLVFDVRFLPNPYYVESLKPLTGENPAVSDYVMSGGETREFFAKLCDMLDFLLPLYVREGKRYLVVCIGCTGGRHRSVAIAAALCRYIEQKGYPCDCVHRDSAK
ncbi:MAG: RNase adapter RapZ [Oscillospiraceae bacterium]|nr:RNase adapter RapZ [Oscillospiraceae bacterium]